MRTIHTGAAVAALLLHTAPALGQGLPIERVSVTIENLAPSHGTFQTPFWVGFHDGAFDLYDQGLAASALVGGDALERLAEDGDTGPLSAAFLASGAGTVDGTIVSADIPPFAPGERATAHFLVDPAAASSRYFSYASMVIPSNDAFVANGNPRAHPLFDAQGRFVAEPFIVTGAQVLDAGTEVNDELPPNTAFFGQMAPDTGVDENGVVHLHPGFLPPGSGGILDAPMFAAADFQLAGYPVARIGFRSAPAVVEDIDWLALLDASQEVPPVASPAQGAGRWQLRAGGTRIDWLMRFFRLRNVVGIHLHLAPPGENGPIVVGLYSAEPGGGGFPGPVGGSFTAQDLVGPLAGAPLDALAGAIQRGEVYVNVHTSDGLPGEGTGPGDFPSGEIRGQLMRF